MALTAAEAKARKTRMTETVKVALDTDWARKVGAAQARVADIERRLQVMPNSTAMVQEMDAAREEIEGMLEQAGDMILEVKFVGLSEDRYDRIVRAHPPTGDQRKEAARDGRPISYNTRTFPIALVQACWISPRDGWSDEDIAELFDDGGEDVDPESDEAPAGARWNSAERASLFMGAQAACVSRHQIQ